VTDARNLFADEDACPVCGATSCIGHVPIPESERVDPMLADWYRRQFEAPTPPERNKVLARTVDITSPEKKDPPE
jgi:hypothetical protein